MVIVLVAVGMSVALEDVLVFEAFLLASWLTDDVGPRGIITSIVHTVKSHHGHIFYEA